MSCVLVALFAAFEQGSVHGVTTKTQDTRHPLRPELPFMKRDGLRDMAIPIIPCVGAFEFLVLVGVTDGV